MDVEKGKKIQQCTDPNQVSVGTVESQEAQVINFDGKPSVVMITKKRSRSVTIHLDQDCHIVDNEIGRNACKYRRRSMIWDHITELSGFDSLMVECNYLRKVFLCDTSKNWTGQMSRHLEFRCPKAPKHVKKTDPLQKLILNGIEGVTSNAYNAENCKITLAEMVIRDELLFMSVEADGFRRFCKTMQPKFSVPSRKTITRDCLKLYRQDKTNLRNMLEGKRT